ncbi:hypothetical protein GGF38_005349 [Coemansia sp. RSA 25]|nr:hypothetical protein GGF38_005349 [Coemansia sp. RSA 25]
MRHNEGFDRRFNENVDSGCYSNFDTNGRPIQVPSQQGNDNVIPQEHQFYEQPHQLQQPGFDMAQEYHSQQPVNAGYCPSGEYANQPPPAQYYEQNPNFGQLGGYNDYQQNEEYMQNGRPDEQRGGYDSGYNSAGDEYGRDRGMSEIKQKVANYYVKQDSYNGQELDKVKIAATAAVLGVTALAIGMGAKKLIDDRRSKDDEQRDDQIGGGSGHAQYDERPSYPNEPYHYPNEPKHHPSSSHYGSS